MSLLGNCFVRIGNEKSTTLNCWKPEPFYFIKKTKKKNKKKNLQFLLLLRNKEVTCLKIVTVRLVPESENSCLQELLQSRTAGAERVNSV